MFLKMDGYGNNDCTNTTTETKDIAIQIESDCYLDWKT